MDKKVFRLSDLIFSFPWGITLLVFLGMVFQGLEIAGYPQMMEAFKSITGIEVLKWIGLIWLMGWPLAYLGFAAVRATEVIEGLRKQREHLEFSKDKYYQDAQVRFDTLLSIRVGIQVLMENILSGPKSISPLPLRQKLGALLDEVRAQAPNLPPLDQNPTVWKARFETFDRKPEPTEQ